MYKNFLKKKTASARWTLSENVIARSKTCAREEEKCSLEYTSIAIQTDLCMQDIEERENLKQSQEAGNSVLSKSWFEADEERLKFHTSSTAMSVMMAERKLISKFQQLLFTFMRLRISHLEFMHLPCQECSKTVCM